MGGFLCHHFEEELSQSGLFLWLRLESTLPTCGVHRAATASPILYSSTGIPLGGLNRKWLL